MKTYEFKAAFRSILQKL